VDDLEKQMMKRATEHLAKMSAADRKSRELSYAQTIMLGWIAADPSATAETVKAMAVPARAAAVALCDACEEMASG